MSTVLVVTNKDDPHADEVIPRLDGLGATVFRLNTEDLPGKISITHTVAGCESSKITTSTRQCDLKNIFGVWYRRPLEPRISEAVRDEEYRGFAIAECSAALDGVLLCTRPRVWVNHPEANRIAGNKLFQLAIAKSIGLRVPASVITNDSKEAIDFVRGHQRAVIKPLTSPLINRGAHAEYVYATVVDEEALRQREYAIRHAPVIFQEFVTKLRDIRVTVIGREVYAVAIESQEDAASLVDFRRGFVENLRHIVWTLPSKTEELCRRLTYCLKLNFSTIDFAEHLDGSLYFLEINPNGQFGWLTHKTDLPLYDKIAALLNGSLPSLTDSGGIR